MEIVREALISLPDATRATGEVELNRDFQRMLGKVQYLRIRRGQESIDWAPSADGDNFPIEEHPEAADKKKPDIQWVYVDGTTPEFETSHRPFVVECKRVGPPSSSGWKFNEKYVVNGVSRFTHREWMYGRNARSGVMVGYIQGMSPNEIHQEINRIALRESLPELGALNFSGELYECDQSLNRSFVITPFTLFHLWVDLRSATPSLTSA